MRFMMLKKRLKHIFFKMCYVHLYIMQLFEKKKFRQKNTELFQKKQTFKENSRKLSVSIAPVKGDKSAIVTVISDDGFFESGVLLNELVKKYDIRATVSGAVAIVKPHLNEWQDIVSEGYVEMVNHSSKHVAMQEESDIGKDKNRLYYEIVRAKHWLNHNFREMKQLVFVCPGNTMCKLGYDILKENHFFAVRRGDRGFNSLSPEEGINSGQWFNLMVQGIGDEGVDTKKRNSWVDEAVRKRQWLIEMWHNVATEDDGFYQTIMKEDVEEHISYISQQKKEEKIWVATFTEATKYLREKQEACVEAYWKNDCIYVSAALKDGKISEEFFNVPITIKIKLPEELTTSSFQLNGNIITIIDENILMIDIVPDGKITKVMIKA